MTSKFQTRPFPKDKLLIRKSITVKTQDGQTVEIGNNDLDLDVVNNQLCYIYKPTGEIIPICRLSTIKRLFQLA